MIKDPGYAGIRTKQPSSHRQGSGLACSIRPDQPEHAAAPHFEIEMINCPLESEGLAEPDKGKRCSHAAVRRSTERSRGYLTHPVKHSSN